MTDKRLKVRVFGVVQGVGFRPFVHNLAQKHGLVGNVCNKGPFVDIEIQGGEQKLAAFLRSLRKEAPARSIIRQIDTQELPIAQYNGFAILQSENTGGEVFPSPDIGICDDCKRELFDKNDRRYLHPFINCTACGPRLTILDEMPYDRARTSMGRFPMCKTCEKEYTSPENRRYHAQPVCCNDCGPQLEVIGNESCRCADINPIIAVRSVIRNGGIAAVKGIGGFHLCCDARNTQAVSRLRMLKGRPAKPFAVMVRDIDAAKRECYVDAIAEKHLDSPEKPILLLEKRCNGLVCEQTAPENPNLGLMLPYAPVQLLIFNYPDGEGFTDCLVMTSGNRGGEPICKDGNEAAIKLSSMCDIILSNNREIRMRADDSVMSLYKGKPYMLRRSRGYSPLPVTFVKKSSSAVFAVGGELKNAFCLGRGDKLYLSAHIGDLSGVSSVETLDDTYKRFKKLLRIEPEVLVCDLHPRYNSTAYAKMLANEQGLPILQVQHHYAHVAACMAENNLDGEVIGVAFDGTGYGTDGTIWGGEFLRASYDGFERISSVAPFAFAGGDAASREGWRPAIGQLAAVCGFEKTKEFSQALSLCSGEQFAAQTGLIKSVFNCVTSTSVGRLFDAASAILGLKRVSTYEGEAALALETAAERYLADGGNHCTLPETNTNDIIKSLAMKVLDGEQSGKLAYAFHATLAQVVLRGCEESRRRTGLSRVALSGGVFANRLLLQLCEKNLTAAGFKVFRHSLVPCNDGGIALGQAAIALYRK